MNSPMVGRVTPCAPGSVARDDGAHGVTRPTFVVRRTSGFAQKFTRNVCGTHASGVADAEASKFEQPWQAELKIVEAGLDRSECRIEATGVEAIA